MTKRRQRQTVPETQTQAEAETETETEAEAEAEAASRVFLVNNYRLGLRSDKGTPRCPELTDTDAEAGMVVAGILYRFNSVVNCQPRNILG